MNLTLQIMRITPPHVIPDPAKSSRRLARGDIICVWDADVVAPWNGTVHVLRDVISSDRFVFVHIRSVPDRVSLGRVRELLTQQDVDLGTLDGRVAILAYYRRSRWGVAIDDIPNNIRNRLNNDRQITATWTQVKNYLKRVRENALITDNDL